MWTILAESRWLFACRLFCEFVRSWGLGNPSSKFWYICKTRASRKIFRFVNYYPSRFLRFFSHSDLRILFGVHNSNICYQNSDCTCMISNHQTIDLETLSIGASTLSISTTSTWYPRIQMWVNFLCLLVHLQKQGIVSSFSYTCWGCSGGGSRWWTPHGGGGGWTPPGEGYLCTCKNKTAFECFAI